MKIKSLLFAMTIIAVQPAQADIDTLMEDVFGSMVNVTDGSAYQSQTRGALIAPRVTVRNQISNPSLVQFQSPTVDAGCGGIDVFGGSLSFISADQFTQMLRNIASNATGYAFGLALEAMCPTCKQEMSRLQKMVNSWNQSLSDSCTTAKYLVNSTGLDDAAYKATEEAKIANANSVSDDWIDAMTMDTDPYGTATGAGNTDHINTNPTWVAMYDSQLKNWYSTGDDDLMAMFMNYTGMVTIVYDDAVDDAPRIVTRAPTIDINTLLNGGTVSTMWKCTDPDDGACTNITFDSDVEIKGMKSFVREVLVGDGTTSGLVTKFKTNIGALTDQEKAFMETAPVAVAAMVRNLARTGTGVDVFVEQATDTIALQMTYEIATDILRNVQVVIQAAEPPNSELALSTIQDKRKELNEKYKNITYSAQSVTELTDIYNSLKENVIKTDVARVQ